MKLTKIALSVIAVVGAVSVGGSWYTGKQVEEKYHQLVSQANQQFANTVNPYGVKVAIKDVQIERHFFSSDAKYRLEVDAGEGEKLEFIGNDTLHHGPLPLNRLAKFNFSPVLMSMENRMQAPEQFKQAMGEKLGSGVANISYSGAAEGEFTLSPIKYSDEKGTVDVSPAKMVYSYDQNVKNNKGTVQLESFKFQAEGTSLQLNGLDYTYQQADDQGYPYLGLGEMKFTLKSIEVKEAEQEKPVFLKDMVYLSKTALQGERVVSGGTIEAKEFNVSGADLGKWKMALDVNADAKLANETTLKFSQPEALEDGSAVDGFVKLLGKAPKLDLHSMSFEKGDGKVEATLALHFNEFNPMELADFNAALNALAPSKFTANINRAYLEEFGRQMSIHSDKLSEEEAKVKAKEVAEQFFVSAASTDFAKVEGDTVKVELAVGNGKVTLNGRELAEEEIQMALFMLMMGAGSLGQ